MEERSENSEVPWTSMEGHRKNLRAPRISMEGRPENSEVVGFRLLDRVFQVPQLLLQIFVVRREGFEPPTSSLFSPSLNELKQGTALTTELPAHWLP